MFSVPGLVSFPLVFYIYLWLFESLVRGALSRVYFDLTLLSLMCVIFVFGFSAVFFVWLVKTFASGLVGKVFTYVRTDVGGGYSVSPLSWVPVVSPVVFL